MCNTYSFTTNAEAVAKLIAELGLTLCYPEGVPNFEPRDEIRITDRAPILRAAPIESQVVDLVQRRWSWPGPGGKPVYNFRSENRHFPNGRCLIAADGFYEFTTHSDPKSRRKHKWRFTLKGAPWFCIAGLWRSTPEVGEAFTMLTTEPGADVAPYHGRQVVVLEKEDWRRWLDPSIPARALLRPLSAGRLRVEQVC